MKTAISVPAPIFEEAERLTEELRMLLKGESNRR